MNKDTKNNTKKNTNNKVIPFHEINKDKVNFVFNEQNKKDSNSQIQQKMLYTRYDGENGLMFQTPWTQLVHGGIPGLNAKYITEQSQRMNLKFPDDGTPLSKAFFKKLKELDEKFGSEKFRKDTLNSKDKNLQYSPLCKESNDDKPDSTKVNIMLVYNDAIPVDERQISTQVYLTTKDKIRKEVSINTIDDIAAYVPYLCKFRCILTVVKMWVSGFMYGIKLGVVKIEVDEDSITKNVKNKSQDQDITFLDSDSDEEDDKVKKAEVNTTDDNKSNNVEYDSGSDSDKIINDDKSKNKNEEIAQVNSDSDDSDDDSDDSDDSDDDSDDSNNKVTVTKTVNKAKKPSKESDDDSEEDNVKKSKKVKKNIKSKSS